jgi:hypothetical protein
LLLGYYTDDGLLHYAERASTGITDKELKRLGIVLAPLHVPKMLLTGRRRVTAASVRRSSSRCGRKWS